MLVTEATDGSAATRSSIEVTFCRTAVSRTDPSCRRCTTIWSVSPACRGSAAWSRACAFEDSSPGRLNASE